MANEFCPFRSSGSEGSFPCPRSGEGPDGCMVWDSVNLDCGVKTLFWAVQSANALVHIHRSHWHKRGHLCAEGESTEYCGGYFEKDVIGHAMVLVNEFMSNQDYDGVTIPGADGSVYGFNFKIADDGNKPPMLLPLEDQYEWPNPTVEISWSDYLLLVDGRI